MKQFVDIVDEPNELFNVFGSEKLNNTVRYLVDKTKSIENTVSLSHGVTVGETLGTNIHELQWSADFPLMKEYGVKTVRDAIVWHFTEQTKGVYDFVNNGHMNYDTMMNKFTDNGLRPLIMLLYSNNLYTDNWALDNEAVKAAYVNWADAVTKRYAGKGTIWEIYNEPNGEWFWNPQTDSAKNYADVVKRVYPIIKRNDPSSMVVAPALAELKEDTFKWIEDTLKEGVLDFVDAISVHPYRTNNPETVIESYRTLRALIGKYTDRDIKIISSEWGYSDPKQWDGLDAPFVASTELEQAQFVSRMLLVNHSQELPISIVYDWKNDGTDEKKVENHFGMLDYDQLTPKMSGTAFKVLNEKLGDYYFIERVNTGKDNDFVFKYMTLDSQVAYAYWTTDSDHSFILNGLVTGTIYSMLGQETHIEGENVSLTISKSPNYLLVNEVEPVTFETKQKSRENFLQAKEDMKLWTDDFTSNSISLDNVHMDNVTKNGSYRMSNLTTGRPTGVTYANVEVFGNIFDEQTQRVTDIQTGRIYQRNGTYGGTSTKTWGAWDELVKISSLNKRNWVEPTLSSPVTKHATEPFHYEQDLIGRVTGEGAVKTTATGVQDTLAFTFPVGKRPSKTLYKIDDAGKYVIEPTGKVRILDCSNKDYFSMNFSFLASQ